MTVRSCEEHTYKINVPTFEGHYDDVYLSYLPLAHNFDRACHILMFMCGGQIGYYSRDIRLLTDDLMTLRPTLFATVPRVLNRLYDTVYAEANKSRLKSALLNWAVSSKQREIERFVYRKDSIWDKLIFHKVQEKLGGRIRMVLTGSAPLSPQVLTFLRCALGCVVRTHVCDCLVFICCKADFLMKGYYKEPAKTAEALDADGWLHTGDVGTWLPNGTLKIVDRKKNIFKLSQGEYIAAEKIEQVYQSSPFVSQVFVDGDSLKVCRCLQTISQLHILGAGLVKAKDTVLADLLNQGKKAGLKGFEQVKDIYLEKDPFTVDNKLLTPTFKNRRPELRKKYKRVLSDLYSRNGF
uniref:long-chain-fatty-acid--CoA ligase n=1 Tax=Biomphalaria glabrata TaxID=6526 RepID=A0A2C9KQK4_BIOGL